MAHHYPHVEQLYNQYQINKKIADKLFRRNEQDQYDFKWRIPTLQDSEDKWKVGRETAERDGNNHYPKTVEENMRILADYLKLLQGRQIRATLVVYPVTRYYAKYFPKAMVQEFHSIIHKLQSEYDFTVIDAFQSPQFDDGDFFDVSHLNWRGAEKFTQLLSQYV